MISKNKQGTASSLEEEISKISNIKRRESLKKLLKNYKKSGDERVLQQIQKILYKFTQARRASHPDVLKMPGWEKEGLPLQRFNGS